MSKTIYLIAALMAIVALSARAQVKCHVIGTVADGTVPSELVICKDHTDPKDSPMRLAVNNGRFEYDIEESQIEKYNIVDFGEVLEKGMTSRLGDFFVEDGATITIHLDGDEFQITSTGKEFQKWQAMQDALKEKFLPVFEKIDEDDEAAMEQLDRDIEKWTLDYYSTHPTLGFLLDLYGQLSSFRYNDTQLGQMLDIYHQKYTSFCPEHPVHQRIAEQESKEYQICGHKYNDYDIRTMDGQKVRASDYFKDHLTLVVCWASWCSPCIREANDVIPIYQQYHDRGLNVFSLSNESKSTDAMRKIVERNGYPWNCFVDIDNEFGVFERHGTHNSALFLIDRSGTIIAVPDNVDDLKKKLAEIFNE